MDVVLHFEGDRNTTLRMVRGVKNRFGAADEVGCFLLQDNGIQGVADPSGLFLDQRPEPVPGTAVTVTLDGKRPLIGEIQSLLARPVNPGAPRRAAVSGIDQARVAMIVAVLEKRAMVPIGELWPPPSWPCATMTSIPASTTCRAWRVVPTTAMTTVPLAFSRSIQGPGLPRPAA